jgi:hypothetical protein
MTTRENKLAELPRPLPATASIPSAGRLFYGAGRERSYRLAKAGAIVTLDAGPRTKIALLHPQRDCSGSTQGPPENASSRFFSGCSCLGAAG